MKTPKPDTTSPDYRAGYEAGRFSAKTDTMRQVQDVLSRLAHEVKQGQHQKSGLNLLREAWRRIRG